jgi:hypothetical protein
MRKGARRDRMARPHRAARPTGPNGLPTALLGIFILALLFVSLPGWSQEQEESEFRGAGIHIKLRGSWVMFAGGDIDKGTAGMFDQYLDDIVTAGFELARSDKRSFHDGYEIAGDIVYHFTPRIGIGVGGGLIRGREESSGYFHWPGTVEDYRLTGLPDMKVISVRLGLFYALPLNRLLTVSVSAGPEYHFATYHYGGVITTPYYQVATNQRVDARQLGVYGGLGLEIRMNRRLAFCIEALGRYAKISGFEGNEAVYEWSSGQSTTVQEQGTLYFIEGEQHPRLDIFSSGSPGGQGGREAVFDLSGISLQAGLNFKF